MPGDDYVVSGDTELLQRPVKKVGCFGHGHPIEHHAGCRSVGPPAWAAKALVSKPVQSSVGAMGLVALRAPKLDHQGAMEQGEGDGSMK